MSSLVGTLVLLLVALLGARLSFSTERAPPGPRLVLRTGTHFLLIGFVLGPSALGLLTPDATRGLFPFLALGIGWVGFHFGLQLDVDSLRLFPRSHFLLTFGQAAISFLLFGLGAHGAAWALGVRGDTLVVLALGAACTAAVTTPVGIALVSSTYRAKGPVRDVLFFVASLDALVGITALQVTYSLYRPDTPLGPVGGWIDLRWIAAAIGLGIVCGIVFVWLTRRRPSSEELTLYLLGFCAFAAGAALQWGLSPLFVCVTMGAVAANVGTQRRRLLPFLQRWEKMVYVTFLLLAGALLRIDTWLVFPIAVAYAVLRGAVKVVATAAMVGALGLRDRVPARLGLGLIPQGGISIAMAVSVVLILSEPTVAGVDAEAVLFAVIVLGVFLSELIGPFLTLGVLRRAGELPSRPQAPGDAPSPPQAATGAGRDGSAAGR